MLCPVALQTPAMSDLTAAALELLVAFGSFYTQLLGVAEQVFTCSCTQSCIATTDNGRT